MASPNSPASKALNQTPATSPKQHKNLSFLCKVTGTIFRTTGTIFRTIFRWYYFPLFSIYGGLHVDENPNLLNSIFTMMSTGATPDEAYELIEKGDLQLLKISMPVGFSSDLVRLSHVYIAHADSCLWFAIGGENAHEMIRMSLERCREAGGRLRTPLLTAAIDFDRLLAFPQDDATGLTSISQMCVQTMEMVVSEYAPFGSGADESGSDPDLAFRALQLGGSKKISLTLAADESGMLLSGTLGTALLRSWMAPVVQMLDQATTIAPSAAEPMPQ